LTTPTSKKKKFHHKIAEFFLFCNVIKFLKMSSSIESKIQGLQAKLQIENDSRDRMEMEITTAQPTQLIGGFGSNIVRPNDLSK
jgi:hypothetical protein